MLLMLAIATAGLNIAITGSSQGIGLSAAKQLVSEGHTIFHANRDEERSECARVGAGGGVPMVCDLSDLDSIRRFAEDLRRSAPTLDVLCLNAAVAPSTKAETRDVQEMMKVNEAVQAYVGSLPPFLAADASSLLVALRAGRDTAEMEPRW